MLVQIRDEAALSSLSIINLRTYLVSHGWTDQGQWGTRPATVFGVESRERTWEIIVPTRDTVIGYAEGMAHSIAVLAAVEERSEFDVFHDIKAAGADVIRVRSATGSGEEPMSLRQSANLLKDAYDMLAASARAAERPQAAYRGKMSSDVAEYLDKVWPWTGYDQGHSLTLHSPVPAGFGKQQDLGDEFIAPFPRQATSKLAQALGRTRTAIEDVVARDTLDSFKQAVNFGVSANLCDSIADLAKNGQGVEIDLTWADVRPSRVEDSRFQFSSLSADILTEAAKSFRQTEPSYDEQLIAQVVRLEREPTEFDGRAIVVSARDGRPTRMRVEFGQGVYDLIINAFQQQVSISLDGDVYPISNGYELRNPRNLSVLAEL